MYILAARHDDVIPFEGVQMYVQKLQGCTKQHNHFADEVEQCSVSPLRKVFTVSL